ncbi:helix-turn-helix domain-containing protein [Anaerocolumna jejuensis]|uniref:helix-turn-helix domain-containing protein n=1 Tax=Anaerocolumna jejuensis TaxID=259063 RepID=UPI003F7CCD07
MNKRIADIEMKNLLISGYSHYSRDLERKLLNEILCGNGLDTITFKNCGLPLASHPTRHMKNSIICMIAVICRHAADLGADDERCYALGDYYINEIEQQNNLDNWEVIGTEVFNHFITLVKESKLKAYSLPIRRSIQYINQHIYEKCSLKDVASAINLHPNYLTTKFKSEVGILITEYIMRKKMEEAKSLLQNSTYSVTEISEILGFTSLSYFAKLFRKEYSCTPREFIQLLLPNIQ